MYRGRIVEHGPTDDVLHDPLHAYTKLLLTAVPTPKPACRPRRGRAAAARRRCWPRTGPRRADRVVEERPGHFSSGGSSSDESHVGLMLYSLRGDCARDFEGTLRAVREVGYEVELIDLYGHDPHEVRVAARRARARGVRPARVPRADRDDLDALAGELRAVGTDRLVLAWIAPRPPPRRRTPWWPESPCSQKRVRDAGLRLGFHNHDGELRPLDDGRTVLDRLLELDEDRLFFESISAGRGLRAWSRRPGRAPRAACAVGARQDLAPRAEQRFVPVGDGDVGYGDVLPALEGLGIEWLLVEQDEVEEPGSTRCAIVRGCHGHGRERGMRAPARVGIVGCGVISTRTRRTPPPSTRSRSLPAPTSSRRCEALAAEHALEALSVEDLASPSIDIVLNLTPPRSPTWRDGPRSRRASTSTRRSLSITAADAAELVRFADEQKRIGCAPDIFLGRAYQAARAAARRGCDRRAARRLRGDGRRRPGALASRPGHVLPERRRAAAGHGAVLPDGDRGAARPGAARDRVRLDARHRAPDRDRAPHGRAVRRGDADPHGSPARARRRPWRRWWRRSRRRALLPMLLHGGEGELALPDPNAFEGPVQIRRSGAAGRRFRTSALAVATRAGWASTTSSKRSPRIGRTGLGGARAHVVDVATSILASGERGSVVAIESEAADPRRCRSTLPCRARARQPSCDDDERTRRCDAAAAGARRTTASTTAILNGNGVLDPYEDPGSRWRSGSTT